MLLLDRAECAEKVQIALSDNYLLTSLMNQVPEPVIAGTAVHTAWHSFRKTFPHGHVPSSLNKVWRRFERLTIANDRAAYEAAEELNELLANYSGSEFNEKIDGPLEPRGLRWDGKEYKELSAKDFVTVAEVEEKLWDHDSDPRERALPSVINKLKAFLLEAGVPWFYGKQGNKIVLIKRVTQKDR
jgi:hypothetical protein